MFQYGPASNRVYIYDDRGVSAGLGGAHAMDLGPPEIGDNSTNYNGTNISLPMPMYGTNGLWLEIDGVTNQTAAVVLHPPWNVTNGVFDLYYTTNLAPALAGLPISWQWLMRSAPGQTNLYPTNATGLQGYYGAGQINPSSGTDFWIAFPNMFEDQPEYLTNYITSATNCTVTVTCADGTEPDFPLTFTLAPNQITNIGFANENPFVTNYAEVQANGFHITSSAPVSVYALYGEPAASTSFAAYATAMLGTNYCLLASPSYYPGEPGGFSQFLIVGTASNTTVWITPSPTADISNPTNDYITTNLNQGETYQLTSSTTTDDVTGTVITASSPIAVFAGVYLAFSPDTGPETQTH